MKFAAARIDDIKRRNPVDEFAGRLVALRRSGRMMVGACPLCSDDPRSRTATRFECDADHWVCAVCQDGGDVIRLAARLNGLDVTRDFVRVVEILGGVADIDPEEAARGTAERERRRAAKADEAAHYREAERKRCWRMWRHGAAIAGTATEAYLSLRGVAAPPGAHLRHAPRAKYFAWNAAARRFEAVHEGPAMLAAIVTAEGQFAGLHTTWIDLTRANFKCEVVNPFTGEIEPSKKVRGSKSGNHIELKRHPAPRALVIGEGIEKVLAVVRALELAGRDVTHLAAWSSADLGNLGGKAAASVAHPTLTNANGRPRLVPGPDPDFDAPAIVIPDSVDDLVLLGDSTSERFLTECALARGARRYARRSDGSERSVRIAWAPEGVDFDDLLKLPASSRTSLGDEAAHAGVAA
jgi:hypothetical protein